jgi:DNA-binding NarL/FixJ family response regulator
MYKQPSVPSPLSGPQKSRPWRTLIVDDHQVFRNGLKDLLENEPDVEVCGEAESEQEALEKLRATEADLVTVDLSLSSGHGLNLVRQIKKEKPQTIVLVLSMFDERIYAERALDAGASGYLCKQAACEEITRALRTVRGGDLYLSEEVLQRVLRRNLGSVKAPALPDEHQLSDRELEILALIGRGRTTQQISESLHVAVSTVETYRERIKSKLHLESGAELTRYAIHWAIHNA